MSVILVIVFEILIELYVTFCGLINFHVGKHRSSYIPVLAL